MSYTDLRDFIPEHVKLFNNANIVCIEKAGGGTVGKYYRSENWFYLVLLSDGPTVYVCAKGTMTLNGSHDHESAAQAVYEYYELGDI